MFTHSSVSARAPLSLRGLRRDSVGTMWGAAPGGRAGGLGIAPRPYGALWGVSPGCISLAERRSYSDTLGAWRLQNEVSESQQSGVHNAGTVSLAQRVLG